MGLKSALKCTVPLVLLAAVVACGDGGGSEPIVPQKPNEASGGSGGAGGSTSSSGPTTTTTGAGGGGGETPMPDPGAEWGEHGASHSLRAELQVMAPDEMYAVAGDPLEVGDVIAMYGGGSQWMSMTDGRGGLRNAFHYIPPLDPLVDPAQFVAVVSNHLEMWDGLAWNIITPDAPGLHAGLHYLDADNIYAPVAQQIQMYDGLQDTWVSVTDDVPAPYEMTRAFHWVSDIEIYALVENGTEAEIMMWDGQWNAMTTPMEGLKPEIHFVSASEIYAVIGSQICLWDGSQWSPWTDELTGLQNAFAFMGQNDIYAVAGLDQVWRWTP